MAQDHFETPPDPKRNHIRPNKSQKSLKVRAKPAKLLCQSFSLWLWAWGRCSQGRWYQTIWKDGIRNGEWRNGLKHKGSTRRIRSKDLCTAEAVAIDCCWRSWWMVKEPMDGKEEGFNGWYRIQFLSFQANVVRTLHFSCKRFQS